MNLQSVVEEVKGRVETISTTGQKVAEISLDSLKQAGDIVVESFQTLVTDNTAAAKEIYSAALSSFEKAKTDGLKAVAAAPISYLPTTELVVAPFSNSVNVVSKTGDELYQVVKTGFSTIQAQLAGKPVTIEKAVKTVKTTAKKASSTVKKAAAKVAKEA